MSNAYAIEIEIMAEQGGALLAGSVLKADFKIRDEQQSLVEGMTSFDCRVYRIPSPKTGVADPAVLDEFQAYGDGPLDLGRLDDCRRERGARD